MIRHRGATAPYDESAIRRLIAGAIQGMGVDDVVIVAVPASEAPSGGEHLTSIGPISVARGSSGLLRAVLGVLLGTNVLLAIALVAAIVRRRTAIADAPPPRATTTTTKA
jgi:hypothetical protein